MEINYVCSLGKMCHSATLIKRNNFKFCSFPFDWVFSSPKVVISCLKDRFKSFLDKSNYIYLDNHNINDRKWK